MLHEVRFGYPKHILRCIMDQWLPALPQNDIVHDIIKTACCKSFEVERSTSLMESYHKEKTQTVKRLHL